MLIILLPGCARSTPPKTDNILASGAITALSEPVDLTYRPCRLDFFHITRFEETDNAVSAEAGNAPAKGYNRVARGTIEATPSTSGLNWRLDVTRMEVNGNQTSHRQASLTTGQFATDHRGQKSQWQISLPAYEDTGASRFFSPARLAGLKDDTRALADDLVPYRFTGPVRTGDRLLRIKAHALPQLFQRMGINGRPQDLMPQLDELVLAVEGWRPYQGRRILMASGEHQIEFDTDRPPQHHRLEMVAVYTIDEATSCPVTGFLHLDLQTTYLSYTRHAILRQEWGYQNVK
ncbi:MAG: hypothetical protein HF981_12745 [Desulfobacteraceae bacterium]|nr:hypothetical protein [Desulfobacteraceae bacterium]MBC2751248.1 hypothetical protein [Desulfobacteraceae bacterium]